MVQIIVPNKYVKHLYVCDNFRGLNPIFPNVDMYKIGIPP